LVAKNSVLQHIASPYASALYELAEAADDVKTAENSLDGVSDLIEKSNDFQRFLRSPVIGAEIKNQVLREILKKAKTQDLVANFLNLVARNGRLFALPEMIASFKEIAARKRGEVAADVTSAVPLSQDQLNLLADTLKKKLGKTVTLNSHVDPSLIGGLQVKVGSQMIDSSLKTKLTAMKIAMKEVG
jgi:F-type H+-transporting ATPase subunit delta